MLFPLIFTLFYLKDRFLREIRNKHHFSTKHSKDVDLVIMTAMEFHSFLWFFSKCSKTGILLFWMDFVAIFWRKSGKNRDISPILTILRIPGLPLKQDTRSPNVHAQNLTWSDVGPYVIQNVYDAHVPDIFSRIWYSYVRYTLLQFGKMPGPI